MPRFRVHFNGYEDIDAEEAITAEIHAASNMSVENCTAELLSEDDEQDDCEEDEAA